MAQVLSLQSKSSSCRASLLLVEQVFKNLKRGGQVWALVLSGAPHKEWAWPFIGPWTWACWARQVLSHILSSSGGITKEILPQFQWLCWIKSLRRRAFSLLLRSLTMRLLKGPSLIHLSNQRDKQLIPFLILVAIHLIPFLITSSPNRADQVVE